MSKKNSKKSDIKCDIIEEYGRVGNKMYAKISWNDGEPRDEIRIVTEDSSGNMRFGKGIAITGDELRQFFNMCEEKEKREKGVDFNAIFASSGNIIQHRQDGHTTKDGFIELKKRKK